MIPPAPNAIAKPGCRSAHLQVRNNSSIRFSEPVASSEPIVWKTKREMAAYLRCTERHVNELMRRGVLPHVKHRGFVRFDLNECNRALEAFKNRSKFGLIERRVAAPGEPSLAPPLPPEGPAPKPQRQANVGTPQVLTFRSLAEACAACQRQNGRTTTERQVLAVIVISASDAPSNSRKPRIR